MRFEVVAADNWSEIIRLSKARKIDVLPSIVKNRQRQAYLIFTRPYDRIPGIVVSSQDYDSIDDLAGKRIAVVSDTYWDDMLTQLRPHMQIQHIDSTEFGMELAAMGAVDGIITDLATATAVIRKTGISGLKIIRDSQKILGALDYSMGVRSDWPELRDILDQALASISPAQKAAIRNKWIQLEEPVFWRDRNFLFGLAVVAGIIALLFLGILAWNRMLKRQVAIRTEELNSAQAKLMQAEKMESIGRLAAGIAHEVKNPLAIIQMGMDYLSQEIGDDPTTRNVEKDIDDAIARANTVIHGLLDFSRETKLQLQQGDINTAIQGALHLVEHELKQHNIEPQLQLSDHLPHMQMDKNRLQQVFINLFMNAVQAMQHDGQLVIVSKTIVIGNQPRLMRNGRNDKTHSGGG